MRKRQKVGGCGEILHPGAEDLRHHVPGRHFVHMVDSHYAGEIMKAREGLFVSSTHGSCRMVLMALYDGSEVLWFAMGEGKGGNPDRTGVFGKHEPPFIILVSGFTSTLGPYCLGALLSGAYTHCAIGKVVSVKIPRKVTTSTIHRIRGIMAPKRSAARSSRTASGRPCIRVMSKEQRRAAQSAKHFKENVSPEIQADIMKTEQEVWAEVDNGIPEAEFNDIADWIHDPGKTYGRIGLYQRAVTYFWASKCLLAKMMADQKGKEPRHGIPVPLWDLHYNDARLMHKKIDVIAMKMGIRFVAPEVALSAKATARSGGGQNPQPPNAQVP